MATGRVTGVNRRAEDDIQITVQHASGVVSIYGGLAASEVKVNDWLEEGKLWACWKVRRKTVRRRSILLSCGMESTLIRRM